MTKNQRKILAEWYGYKTTPVKNGRRIVWYLVEDMSIGNEHKRKIDWIPDKDSNQRDLLKQKFIKDANITRIEYDKMITGWWQALYYIGVYDGSLDSKGKGINDADLNAIINYVESL